MDRIPDNGPMENPPPNPPLAGLNPADLLRQGAAADTIASVEPFLPPTLEEMAALFPQFEILELIGKGGMGAVYKVRQKQLDRIVALKILPPAIGRSPAFSDRFAREAKALAKLNHPGIVTLHEFGRQEELYFILMEYVDGVNLAQLMRSNRISPREALAIVPQICDALQFAHDQGIVHRDIKPENVLLDRLGRVKVADFGLAKLTGDAPQAFLPDLHSSPLHTEAGKVMGTPQYMAPEQIDHPADVDHRADIYALGVVFYQMLTGELPGSEIQAPSRKVHIDVRLDEIVLRALEKNPEARYPHASVMKTMVENIVAGQPDAIPSRMAALRNLDYRSRLTCFGLPLLHVTSGPDPLTGREREARGIVAIGGKATGVIAFGGRATGVVAIGGLALGLVAFGGVAVGGVAWGGVSLAVLAALGGLALGFVALGGSSIGYFSYGGAAFGRHCLGGNASDPLAKEFFLPWAQDLMGNIGLLMPLFLIFVFAISFGVPLWAARRQANTRDSVDSGDVRPATRTPSSGVTIAVSCGIIACFVVVLMLVSGFLLWSYMSVNGNQDPVPTVDNTVRTPEPQFPTITEIGVTGESLTMDDKPMSPAELESELKTRAAVRPDLSVKVFSDSHARYSTITEVLDICGKVGIKNIDFSNDKSGMTAPPAASGALLWLGHLDADRFADSYAESSEMVKAATTNEQWRRMMVTYRQPLGAVISRRLKQIDEVTSLPGVPDGEHRVMTFETEFDNKKHAMETVTFTKEKDQQWRASGYFVR